jgi:hypothetical protein
MESELQDSPSLYGIYAKVRWLPLLVLILLCASCKSGEDEDKSAQPSVTVVQISSDAGRVAWYRGSVQAHELLAFDRVVNTSNGYTQIYTMKPDGSNESPVTGAMAQPFSDGFIGQPEWHPDGDHIIFQVKEGGGSRFEHMSFGINNDLWLIKKDGSGAEKLLTCATNAAILHPHFNSTGDKLIWADREPTGVPLGIWITAGAPGGENPWAGWRIAIADFDINAAAGNKVSNIQYLFSGGTASSRGFFETHGFYAGDTRITWSRTLNGDPYVDDIFSCKLDGSDVQQIVNNPGVWEEHGTYAPGETAVAFNSSRVDPSWSYPGSTASTLSLEVYLLEGGNVTQLTDFNTSLTKRYLTSDFEWDRSGTRIVVEVVPVDKLTSTPGTAELWMITLPSAK